MKIAVETNPIECFRKNSSLRMSLDFVENHLAGVGSVDISLKATDRDAFKDPLNLQVIDRSSSRLPPYKGLTRRYPLSISSKI